MAFLPCNSYPEAVLTSNTSFILFVVSLYKYMELVFHMFNMFNINFNILDQFTLMMPSDKVIFRCYFNIMRFRFIFVKAGG
jgi:hypothetical protein